jgi:hypothetical protein
MTDSDGRVRRLDGWQHPESRPFDKLRERP